MAYISKTHIDIRIAGFFARQAKKVAAEAAAYANLAKSSGEMVGATNPAPDPSATGKAETVLAFGALAAEAAKLSPASGMLAEDHVGGELFFDVLVVGQTKMELATGVLTANQAGTTTTFGTPSGRQEAIVLPDWQGKAPT